MALLHRWNDWSAGMGFPRDDGKTPGYYYASGFLGLDGELRLMHRLNSAGYNIYALASTWRSTTFTGTATHAAALFASSATGVDVAIQNADVEASGTGSATLTYAFTVTAGSNQKLVVFVGASGNTPPATVTFNGDALTEATVATGLYAPYSSIWYRDSPDVVTGNIVITFGGVQNIVSVAQAFINCATGTSAPITEGPNTRNTDAFTGYSSVLGFGSSYLDTSVNHALVDILTFVSIADDATVASEQTEIMDKAQTTIRSFASYKISSTGGEAHLQYIFEDHANLNPVNSYLYASFDTRRGASTMYKKFDLQQATFGTSSQKLLYVYGAAFAGQPAKYQSIWYIPTGNNTSLLPVTITDTVNWAVYPNGDISDHPSTGITYGADHLIAFGNQLAGIVRERVSAIIDLNGVGVNAGGIRILKVDGTVATAGHWGSVFPAGDPTKRAGGITNIQGMSFALMPDGLYSFDSEGRSGLVLLDLGQWENYHVNVQPAPWKGGFFIPHPSGLLFYTPGQLPINVGLDGNPILNFMPNSQVTEIHGGVYHSVTVVGDYVYVVYQPDSSSTTAVILCGYSLTNDPTKLIWQGLTTITLLDKAHTMGCGISRASRPISADYVTPTFWTQTGITPSYLVLDPRGSPFRSRADTTTIVTSANLYTSEIYFPEPVKLTDIEIFAEDFVSGDSLQLSLILDGNTDTNVGAPITASGRHTRKIDRRAASDMVLHLTWTSTSNASRVPPTIKAIDLNGAPIGRIDNA